PHEVGHALDQNLGVWSRSSKWRAACRRAPRLTTFWRLMDDAGGRFGAVYYYSSPKEMFARAFEYFVATHALHRRWVTHAKRRFFQEWRSTETDELEGLSRCIATNILPALAKSFVVPPIVLENERRLKEWESDIALRTRSDAF